MERFRLRGVAMKILNRFFSSSEYLPPMESCQLPSPVSESRGSNRSAAILNLLIVLLLLALIGFGDANGFPPPF